MTPDSKQSAATRARVLALSENYRSAVERLSLPETGLSDHEASVLTLNFHNLRQRMGDSFMRMTEGIHDRRLPPSSEKSG